MGASAEGDVAARVCGQGGVRPPGCRRAVTSRLGQLPGPTRRLPGCGPPGVLPRAPPASESSRGAARRAVRARGPGTGRGTYAPTGALQHLDLVDVQANDLVLATTGALPPQLPDSVATFIGSMSGAAWRTVTTPGDTGKTVLQTDGQKGWGLLRERVARGAPLGALARLGGELRGERRG